MALNPEILKKIKDKTNNDINMRDFILDVLKYESEGRGHYKDYYRKQLDIYCKEVDTHEN